jgi:hypothetical protein
VCFFDIILRIYRCSFSPPKSCEAITEGAIAWTIARASSCEQKNNYETDKMGGKQKGNSSRTLSSDNDSTPKRPNGQGKARLLINFKDQGAAAAAAGQ